MLTLDQWLNHLLIAIRKLSNTEYQERVWARGDGPEIDSIGEAYCHLFDDLEFHDFLSRCEETDFISAAQVTALDDLRNRLNAFEYDEDLPDAEIIKDPRWQDIREMANEALSKFE
jgi:hypothetical protein